MRRISLASFALVTAFGLRSALWAQLPDDQIFHIDERNTSIISVQNPGLETISARVDIFDQQGGLVGEETRDLPARSATEFASATAGNFVGIAVVSCGGPCLATATWRFTIGDGPGFEVGVLPQLFSNRSRMWAAPVPVIGESSSYGFAIYNAGQDSTACDVTFRNLDGLELGNETVTIAGNGQIARFSDAVAPGFVGGAVISCGQEVIALGLNQNTRNGFPTGLNYAAVLSAQSQEQVRER